MLCLEQSLWTQPDPLQVTSGAFPGSSESSCLSFPGDWEKKATLLHPRACSRPRYKATSALCQMPLLSARQYWVILL